MEKKDAKIIAVSNLKGGVGKSFLNALFASSLHQQNFKVLVIDADDAQLSVEMIRERDIEKGIDEKDIFDILTTNSIDAINYIHNLINDYDYIFIDLPGNIKQPGVIECLIQSDIIFIPTSLSDEDLDSSIKFLEIINRDVIPIRNEAELETEIFGILYKVSTTSIEYKEFEKEKENYPIKFFNTVVPFSERLKRQSSTAGVLEYKTKTFDMSEFISEFYSNLKLD